MLLAAQPLEPVGSLIYADSLDGDIGTADETDSFALDLDANQTLSLVVTPGDDGLRPEIALLDATSAELGSTVAAGSGDNALLQTLSITDAGSYTLSVTGADSTTGAYSIQVVLNAAVEQETYLGSGNDALASAQNLDASMLQLIDGTTARGAVIGQVSGEADDWYSFSVDGDQRITLAVAARPEGDFTLDLYNGAGELVATGIPDGARSNLDQVIDSYAASGPDTWYAAVGGEGDYSLLVTRDIAFEREPNSRGEDAQPLLSTEAALGALARGAGGGGSAAGDTIRVAVHQGGYSNIVVNQLNDDTHFDFNAVAVPNTGLDTIEELRAYDVVVMGNPYDTISAAAGSAIRSWYETGAGNVVGTAWLHFNVLNDSTAARADLDAVVPMDFSGSRSNTSSVRILDTSHPITEGLSASFSFPSGEYSSAGADPDTSVLADDGRGHPTVIVDEISTSRSVWLGPAYFYHYTELGSGNGDRLLEQAVAWAAFGGVDSADQYAFEASAGDTVVITTATPGDGPGEPDNDLDPLLELYNPEGGLVESNNNDSTGDGRNARIEYIVPADAGGTYRVRVSAVEGSGDYTVRVQGATGAVTSSLDVIGTSIADGSVLPAWPDTLELDFSNLLQLTSVEASDLTINGVAADGVTIIDGDTLQFDIALSEPADGGYTFELTEGVLTGIDGSGNALFSMTLTLDTTSPVVVSSSLAPDDLVEPGNMVYTVTFSEELAQDGLGAEDVELRENEFGVDFTPDGFSYDPDTDTLTLEYSGLYDGAYALTLLSGVEAFRDPVDNLLNGAPSFPLPSGQGDVAPDDFVVDFFVDAAEGVPYPVPLDPKAPRGSLIFDPSVNGTIFSTTDADDYTITVDAGQTLTVVVVEPLDGSGLQPVIELFGPGDTTTPLGAASAPSADAAAVLQTVQALTAGEYTMRITGANSTTGGYTARLVLNAAIEEEEYTGELNDDIATAQDLSASAIPLGSAGVDRLAVLGNAGATAIADVSEIGFASVAPGDGVKGMTYDANGYFLLSDGFELFALTTTGSSWHVGSFDGYTSGIAYLGSDFYAVDGSSNQLRMIDPTTGGDLSAVDVSLDGENVTRVTALAVDPGTDELYAVLRTNVSGNTRRLVIIDPDTGNGTILGDLDDSFSAIAFDAGGSLYGLTGDGASVPCSLYEINKTDATTTFIATLAEVDWSGEALAFNPGDDLLYRISGMGGAEAFQSVEIVDDGGTKTVMVNELSVAWLGDNVRGMTYAGGGELFLSDRSSSDGGGLWVLDTSGDLRFIGSIDDGAHGLALIAGDLYVGTGGSSLLRRLDPTSGEELEAVAIDLDGRPIDGVLGLAVDPTTDSLYAILRMEDTGDRELAMLDPVTGVGTQVGVLSDYFSAIAFDADGVLFGLTGRRAEQRESLFLLNKNNASAVFIQAFSYGGSGEALAFNPEDGLLYRASGQNRFGDAYNFQSLEISYLGTIADAYSFDLTAGRNASLVVTTLNSASTHVQLLDASGTVLTSGVVGSENASESITQFVAPADGTYYAKVTADAPTDYSLVITRDATFDLEPNDEATVAQALPVARHVLGFLGDADEYLVAVSAGDVLAMSTTIPGDGDGEPINEVTPTIEVFNSAGDEVADLSVPAPRDDVYRVQVTAANTGEYVLHVDGATGESTFAVIGTTPATGLRSATYPTSYVLELSEAVFLPSVQASDLVVTLPDGSTTVPVSSFSVPAPNRLRFNIADGLDVDGTYTVGINEAAFTGVTQTALTAFSATFVLDTTGPVVVDSSIAEGSEINSGAVDWVLDFSEPLEESVLGVEDIVLRDLTTDAETNPESVSFDFAVDNTVAVSFVDVAEGDYRLTLRSASDAFRDPYGNLLDGDGDGVSGDDFQLAFVVDTTEVDYGPLAGVLPEGSLIHDPPRNGNFADAGDVDTFNISLDAGQTATLRFVPRDASIAAEINLMGPFGVVGSASSGPGESLLLQTAPISEAGAYRIELASLAGSGDYELELILNAALEEESLFATNSNDTVETAQQLDGSSVTLVGQADRLAAVGVADAEGADYYAFSLEAGELASIAVTSQSNEEMTLTLLDAGGVDLALGAIDGENVSQNIRLFSAPAAGEYVARVTGTADDRYSLIVTRGADFDRESNSAADIPQVLTPAAIVLAGLGGSGTGDSSQGATGTATLPLDLFDGSGYEWDLRASSSYNTSGYIINGTSDAYDGGLRLSGFGVHTNVTTEGDGREVVIGPVAVSGLEITRKIYVSDDENYARFLEIVTNPGDTTATYTAELDTNLGSDSWTVVVATSDGDTSFSAADDWLVTDDWSNGGGDPSMLHVISGPDARMRPTTASRSGDDLRYTYDLELPPGQTQIVMHFASQNPNQAAALAKGPLLVDLELNALEGMSYSERAAIVNFAAGDHADYHAFEANAGDEITISTSTPAEGAGDFLNELDPGIAVYDPHGSQVPYGNGGGNESLTFTADLDGQYLVHVFAENDAFGEYVLQVEGAVGAAPPFVATTTAPPDGAELSGYPTTYRVDFSEAFLLTSVDAADLTVTRGGSTVDADNVLVVDQDTLEFDITSGDLGDGLYTLEIAAGAVTSVSGLAVEAFSAHFDYDATNPWVTDSTITEGDAVPPGLVVYEVGFSEELATEDLGAEDVTLVDAVSGLNYSPDAFDYDPSLSQATITYDNLPEGNYTLTLLTSAEAFRDRRGNLLDGSPSFPLPSGDGTPGDPFIVNFVVDVDQQEYPTPLEAVAPLGSLIFDPPRSGVFNSVGDSDAFTVNLDPGQTVTVLLTPQDASITGSVALLGPDASTLATATAAGAGQRVLLQTVAASEAGTYTIDVENTEGSGPYQLELVLNAAVEEESIGGAANDDVGSAQDINDSFIDFGAGATRGAVVGAASTLGSNVAEGKAVSVVEGSVNGVDLNTLVDGSFLARGTYWQTGTVWWTGTDPAFQIDLAEQYVLTGARIQGDDNDSYLFEYLDASDGQWKTLWNVPNYDSRIGGGMITRPDFGFTDGNQWHEFSPVTTDMVRVRATGGDNNYALSEIQLRGYGASAGSGDVYAFDLAEDQIATVVLGGGGSSGRLELLDDTSTTLALGVSGWNNVDEAIQTFTGPAAGTYYARVFGDGEYSLVVTRSGDFALETYFTDFEAPVGAEWSTTARDGTVASFTTFLGRFSGGAGATLTLPTVPGASYAVEFDLMIIDSWDGSANRWGPDYFNVDVAGTQLFHHTFTTSGGSQSYPGTPNVGGANYGWGGWNDAIYRNVTVPFVASGTTTSIRFHDGGLQGINDESWGIDNVRVRPSASLQDGDAVQDISASGNVLGQYLGTPVDFQFAATVGDSLQLYTSTPGGGSGEPVNTLDPALQLLSPEGLLLADADNGGPQEDGRNAGVQYTVPAGGAGMYTARILGANTGAYTLTVLGATGSTTTPPQVVLTSPGEGAKLGAAPGVVDITMSEGVRVDSIDSTDLTIDGGGNVDDVEMIDGRQVRFHITVPDVDGTFTYTLAQDAFTDPQGETSQKHTGTFVIDKSGPRVIEQHPGHQASAPFTQLTFIFDEPVSNFSSTDVTQFTGPGGVSLLTEITGVSINGNEATVTFNAQSARGTYIMQIGPNITDLVGNNMNQDGDEVNGEVGDDDYITTIELESSDLQVDAVALPPSGVLGSPLTFSWTVSNHGSDAAVENWRDQAWLSTDTTFSSDDISLLDAVPPPDGTIPLTPGSQNAYTQEVTVDLPLTSNLDAGVYYVLVLTDALDDQAEDDENNNVNFESIDLSLPPLPDLVVTDIDAPIEGLSGQDVQYSWTVSNIGSGDAAGSWRDRVWLSTDQSLGGGDLYLGDFRFTGTIAAGESIARAQTYTLPVNMEGERWFIVQTDVHNELYEHTNEGNNNTVDDTAMDVELSPFPNLRVTDVIPPTEAFSSQQAVVEWVVTNTGDAPTSAPVWYDRVWLSRDDLLDGSDAYMGQVANASYLNPTESYTNSLIVTLPRGIQGEYYFIVKTDYHNHVYEHNDEDDNVGIEEPTQVTLTPPPDLQVADVSAAETVFSNEIVTVSWTVENRGEGRTLQSTWRDFVYLSDTPDRSGKTFNMGSLWHSGGLNPEGSAGDSYTASLNARIPVDIEGEWFFIVLTDGQNHVYEHVYENNNQNVRRDEALEPDSTTVRLVTPDLEVDVVGGPAAAQGSHSMSFSYSVTNHGILRTPGSSWRDKYYFSTDTTLDDDDLSLGSRNHYGALDPGESYTQLATVTLPDGLSGEFYLLVYTDANNQVFEGPADSLGETNNVSFDATPLVVTDNPPDLVIIPDSFEAWPTAVAGSFLRATWGVMNQGEGDTVGGTWRCKVYASMDSIKGGADDRLLGTFTRSGDLAAGESYYAVDRQVNIPIDLSGTIHLWVRTDADNQVYEGANELNNDSRLIPVEIVQNLADLQVIDIAGVSETAQAGKPVTVTWTVENMGDGRTNALSWQDKIYLTRNQTLGDGDDVYLGSYRRNSPLDFEQSYTVTRSVTVPATATGAYYIGVYADRDNRVFEGGAEDNNWRIRPLNPDPDDPDTPLPILPPDEGAILVPDLVLDEVDAPSEAFSGQPFTLSWTVTNAGDEATGNWYDQVYLSLDQVYDPGSDISLGNRSHHGGLAAGDSYTVTTAFNIPRGLSGPFYVFVAVDRGNYKQEPDELNNVDYDRTSMLVNLLPPADLIVAQPITIPATAAPGFNATLTYTVENEGEDPAIGRWYDSLYISADATWSIDDAFLGRVEHRSDVPGGGSYTETITAPLPGVLPGDYHVIVRSDIRNHIPESDETNNLRASLDLMEVDAQLLELGDENAQTATLSRGASAFYKTSEIEAGETVRISLDGADDLFTELYVRYGAMPSRNQFDQAANQPFLSDQQIVLPVQQTGTYYILAHGTLAPAAREYAISAELIPFSIEKVHIDTVGNAGDATVKVSGARFNDSTTFDVVDDKGHALPAERVFIQDSATAFVTFDLFAVTPAIYTVRATDQEQAVSTVLQDSLTVVEGNGFLVDTNGRGPAVVRPDRNYRFDIDFGNAGDQDAAAPLLWVESANNTRVGFRPDELVSGIPLQIFGGAHEGPLDILRPGALENAALHYNSGGSVDLEIYPITHDDTNTITADEWEVLRLSAKPASIAETDWNAFWANLPTRVGPTWGEYVQFLNQLAVVTSEPGDPVRDVRIMFERIYADNPEFLPSLMASGTALDAESGDPLSNVTLAAYEIVGDSIRKVASTTTLSDGTFRFRYLQPGTYQLATDMDYAFDQDRDGAVDAQAPFLVVEAGQDAEGIALYAFQRVEEAFPEQLSQPALVVDSAGVNQIVYVSRDAIWHAYHDGDGWVEAKVIAEEDAASLSLRAADNLVNGTEPGLIATWSNGAGNEADIHYAVGRLADEGGYEWSEVLVLTDNKTRDVAPDVAVTPSGEVVAVYATSDHEIDDDRDLYFNVFVPNPGTFPNGVPTGPTGQINASDVAFQYEVSFKDPFGLIEEKASIKGQVGVNSCKLTASVSGENSLKIDNETYKSGLSGSGTWKACEDTCTWQPEKAELSFSVGGVYDWENGLLWVFQKIPQTAAIGYGLEGAFFLIDWFTPIKISNGIEFSAGLNASLGWTDAAPFPSWILPDEGSLKANFGLSPYIKAEVDGWEDAEAKLAGAITADVQILPTLVVDKVSGSVTISAQWKSYSLEKSWSVDVIGGSSLDASQLDPLDDPLDGLEWVYNPQGAVGTGNVYGTNSVIADVSSDLWQDSPADLAVGANGNVYAAWAKTGDPDVAVGETVVVSEYDGTAWSAPVAIPDSFGVNRDVNMVVDGSGQRMVVWSMADGSSLDADSTSEEVMAARQDTDVYYSLHGDGQWSAPVRLAGTAGSDAAVRSATLSDGAVWTAWSSRSLDDNYDLMVSKFDGTDFSEPTVVATGRNLGDIAISEGDGQPLVFWGANADLSDDKQALALYSSTLVDGSWSAAELFSPELQVAATGGTNNDVANLVGSREAIVANSLFGIDVPEDCCKCKDWETEYQGTNEGCGFTTTIDAENCKKIITYQPCVRRPVDPNDILGPEGYGDENWVEADRVLDYMIRFENDPEFATAPAQVVTITQQLDSDLDPRTFRLGDFGFGNRVFEVPENRAFYSTRIDLTAEEGYFVDVAAGVDVNTGEVFWELRTVDPETGEAPLDADVGFLAVNDENGSGEGFATYTVRPDRDAQTGDVVDSLARIVFDTNEPLDTPPIFHTLDAVDPVSAVGGLVTESTALFAAEATADNEDFTVQWSGSDDEGGSGLAAFNVYVSENGGDFELWLLGTQLSEALFAGQPGRRYDFYSVAFDNAGNEESAPASADLTVITAGGSATIGDFVWDDVDGDGIQGQDEPGMADVTVRLFVDGTEEALAETTTDSDGLYSFTDVDPADSYFLEFVAPDGYAFSEADQGGDDALDSDSNIGTGRTDVFTVSDGEHLQWDTGLLQLVSISGMVWGDVNGDKTKDNDEVALADRVVYLDLNESGELDEGDQQRTTGDDGRYLFDDLRPGQYIVRTQLPEGWEQTHPDAAGVSQATSPTRSPGPPVEIYAPGEFDDTRTTRSPLDVNADGFISPVDVLCVIHGLNNGTSGVSGLADAAVLDVNGDGFLSPHDALIVIHAMNSGLAENYQGTTGEGGTIADPHAADHLIGMDQLRADSRFAGLDGRGLSVVVIDTGIDVDHPFFGPDADDDGVADRIVFQYDFADNDTNATSSSAHGSHVSGIIASEDGVYTGVAPGVDLIHLKVFSDNGIGYTSYLEEALTWVYENAAQYNIAAVNLSLGDGGNWRTAGGHYGLDDELAALASLGVVTVSAAGNRYGAYDTAPGLSYPAADPNSVAVGAVWDAERGGPWSFREGATDYTTDADRIASFSQRNPTLLDAFAPGVVITSADAKGGVTAMRGTSMASPFVTGAAVLAQQIALEQFGRLLAPAEFRGLLQAASAPIFDGDDEDDSVLNTQASYGRLDLLALAEAVWNYDAPSVAPDGGGTHGGSDEGGIGTFNGVPFAYTLNTAPGQSRDDIDFGIRPLDVTPPNAPTDVGITPDTGVSPDDGITKTGQVTLSGSLDEEELTVSVFNETTGTDLGAADVSSTGFSLALDLAGGAHRLRLTVTDPSGNATDSFFDVFVDLDLPAAPTGLRISPDTGASSTDGFTSQQDVTFSGQLAEEELRVYLYDVSTLTDLGQAAVVGTSFSKELDLAPGRHLLRARAEDSAGNRSVDSFFDVFVDVTPPIADDDLFTASRNTTLHVAAPGVLAGDSDAEGDMLAAIKVTDPTRGTLSLRADGSFDYTPEDGFTGEDTFTYMVSDGKELSAPATVTITVAEADNRAPQAEDDSYSVDEDQTLVVAAPGVLDNDTDLDGNALTMQIVDRPKHGQLIFNPNTGQFTYKPPANFHGDDSFTYQCFDGQELSNVATVSLTVRPLNDVPIAADDSFTLTRNSDGDASLTIGASGVLRNDIDVDGQSLQASKVSNPSHGAVTLNPDGSFTYTPEVGFTGEDSFTYRSTDGADNSNIATVHITVQPPAGAAPWVESVVIGDGSAGRSMVTRLTVTFNTMVTYGKDAFQLQEKNSGAAVAGWTLTDVSSSYKTILELEFPDSAGFTGGSLADGNYLLTILAEDVTAAGQALDGNGDDVEGGDYQFGARDEFFRFFGDGNGDRYVDGIDLGMFRGAHDRTSSDAGYSPYFDYDSDDDVDRDDYEEFAKRYQQRYLEPRRQGS